MSYDPLTFRHLFPSGRVASITVRRFQDSVPKITGEGWPEIHEADWADYQLWRSSVLKPIMENLTDGELIACADYARMKMAEDHKRRTRR